MNQIMCQGMINGTNRTHGDPCQYKAFGFYKSTLTNSGKIAFCKIHGKNHALIEELRKAQPNDER